MNMGEDNMKKLLFVINQLYKGGAETSLVNLLNHLDYSKYSVELLILNQCPVKDAVSLINRINKSVTVCDAYMEYQKITIFDRIRAKALYTIEQKGAYYFTALDFIKDKYYDWAFFVGEWCSPSFVAYEVEANIKAAWMHNDLSEAEYFDAEHYFYFADMFDYFIFVSKHSLDSSVAAFPFLKKKAVTIYNINDIDYIRKRAEEQSDYKIENNKLMVLTCANFRPQKNHLRQIEVMVELKKRGVEFVWVNIGATSDEGLVSRVKEIRDENQLTDQFLIFGPKENPYSYMKQADIVAVLSDYESWSMVITEAKILGKPIIATKTSGAVEQIEDKRTGILTDFSVSDITDCLEALLNNEKVREQIKNNINGFDNTKEIIDSFDELICEGVSSKENVDILYVIDDINYMGGAHIATELQIREFVKIGKKVAIYSSNVPNLEIREKLLGVNFLGLKNFKENTIFTSRLTYCLFSPKLTKEERMRKLRYTVSSYLKKFNYNEMVLPKITILFSKYPTICVISEASLYRKAIAESNCEIKIQWIHTDYCEWKDKNDWTKKITLNDAKLYQKFTTIVVLTDNIKAKFVKLYPHLESKIIVNKNLIPVDEIKEKSKPLSPKNRKPVHFVTIGRISFEKSYPRLIKILSRLKGEGYLFTWTIVGGGEDFERVKLLISTSGLQDEVTMTGPLSNPFRILKESDVFALLSDYEGLPNTIYEALVLGVPVLATNVGGISTQITDGENGWLVENNERKIESMLETILMNQERIDALKENLKSYIYDNDKVIEINKKIFHI